MVSRGISKKLRRRPASVLVRRRFEVAMAAYGAELPFIRNGISWSIGMSRKIPFATGKEIPILGCLLRRGQSARHVEFGMKTLPSA